MQRSPSLRWCSILALASALTLTACGPSFSEYQEKDSIEGWQEFLSQANPSSPDYYKAENRLAELSFELARSEGTPEALDAFLEEFSAPQFAPIRKQAGEIREDVIYAWADAVGTKQAWESFLEEFPKTPRKRKLEARRRIKASEYSDRIALGAVSQERVNLAEDPEGPLNGWGWWVEVTNNTDKAWYKLDLGLYFLDDDGRVLDRRDWPVVARFLPGYLPFETGFDKPMEPGETRTWEYTDGDVPEGWSRKVKVVPVDLIFIDDPVAIESIEANGPA
jgi:hypothetical protein